MNHVGKYHAQSGRIRVESLRQPAREYGMLYEAVRRVIKAAQRENG